MYWAGLDGHIWLNIFITPPPGYLSVDSFFQFHKKVSHLPTENAANLLFSIKTRMEDLTCQCFCFSSAYSSVSAGLLLYKMKTETSPIIAALTKETRFNSSDNILEPRPCSTLCVSKIIGWRTSWIRVFIYWKNVWLMRLQLEIKYAL